MQVKTKLQQLVEKINKELPEITQEHKQWAYDHCFPKEAFRTKHQINCLECGHSWKEESILGSQIVGNTCPSCGAELKVKHTRQRVTGGDDYFTIFQIVEGMQLIRTVWVHKDCKVGRHANFEIGEVTRHWITDKGRCVFFSMDCYSGFNGSWSWRFYNDWILRKNYSGKFYIIGDIYPEQQILPAIRRNGFKGNYHDFKPQVLFLQLLGDKKAETLWKAKQYKLFGTVGSWNNIVNKYWPQIKICLRNKYIVNDPHTWTDYLDQLINFKKDIHNPKFVCPKNLRAAHDEYVEKARVERFRGEIAELQKELKPLVPGLVILNPKKLPISKLQPAIKKLQEKREEVRKRLKWEAFQVELQKHQERYEKEKGKFLGLSFSDGDIMIKTLDTIEEFKIEGEAMHHCVFENKYYQLKGSLILSAQVKGVRIETIELYLNPLQVSQCRGKNNQNSKFHDKILKLLEDNLWQILKRMRVQTKKFENVETFAA